jgi:YYY domain-containing protein
MLEGAGLLALPLSFRLFRHLPDRGYALSKPLGLILVNYVLWMLSTLGFLRNTWGGILFSAVLALGLSLLFYFKRPALGRTPAGDPPPAGRAGLRAWMGEHRRTVIASELVFTLAFLLWVGYKAFDPNIAITEKPMEFAFLNAITRSDRFPPYDPWMSGYSISYYYFGYVIVATMAKLASIPTSIAFNLAIAMLFSLTASGAFSVVYNMVYVAARRHTREIRGVASTAIYYGIVAAVIIPLMGNLEGALEFAHANGLGVTVNEPGNVTGPFWEWIDVKNLTTSGSISETWYPTDGWWWWRASRLIHDKGLTGGDMEVIDEFPAFSFLLGDMHPHVLAYPFVFLVIGLAFNLLLSGLRGQDGPLESGDIAGDTTTGEWWLIYLCLGAIGFLNTWDMPFYYFLLLAAFALNRYMRGEAADETEALTLIERALGNRVWIGLRWPQWRGRTLSARKAVYRAIELAVASVVLYLPYWIYSRPQAGAGILPNLFNVSRMAHLFLMFGVFFVVLAALLIVLFVELRRAGQMSGKSLLRQGLPIWLGTMLFFPVLTALILVPVVLSPSIRTYIDDALSNPDVQQVLGPQTLQSLLQVGLRIRTGLLPPQLRAIRMPAGPWSFLFLSLAIAAILFWFVRVIGSPARRPEGASKQPPGRTVPGGPSSSVPFALLLAFVGLMLIFSVEFVYLRDAFGTRMNTVFKFYFQAWALLGLAAAFGVYYVVDRKPVGGFEGGRIGRPVFRVLFGLLVFAGLLYPLGASLNRTGGFAGPPTLDGVAFVARERPEEHAAVRWLNENAAGRPVIVEAVSGSFAYQHARISSRTGLPAVMGWTGHEGQWHGLYDEIGQREQDVDLLYGGSVQDAKRILLEYDVTYVVVGYLERAEFPGAAAKFERLMDVVFREGDTVIFKTRGK